MTLRRARPYHELGTAPRGRDTIVGLRQRVNWLARASLVPPGPRRQGRRRSSLRGQGCWQAPRHEKPSAASEWCTLVELSNLREEAKRLLEGPGSPAGICRLDGRHRCCGAPQRSAYHHGGSPGRHAEAAGPDRAPPRLPLVPPPYHRRESGTAAQIPLPAAVSHHRRAIRVARCPHSLSPGNGAFLSGGKQWHGRQRPS
jgi:hypothetical protein